jgi:hypothetical protein
MTIEPGDSYKRQDAANERQIYRHLAYLDPALADEDVARKKIAPRAAEDYKRKGG